MAHPSLVDGDHVEPAGVVLRPADRQIRLGKSPNLDLLPIADGKLRCGKSRCRAGFHLDEDEGRAIHRDGIQLSELGPPVSLHYSIALIGKEVRGQVLAFELQPAFIDHEVKGNLGV